MVTEAMGNLVGGRWRHASTGATLEVRDPADFRHIVGRVPAMEPGDVTEVFDAAESGARSWRATGPLERSGVLMRAATLLRERASMLTSVIVDEMGKTTAEAGVEVAKTADFFDYYASLAGCRTASCCPTTRGRGPGHRPGWNRSGSSWRSRRGTTRC